MTPTSLSSSADWFPTVGDFKTIPKNRKQQSNHNQWSYCCLCVVGVVKQQSQSEWQNRNLLFSISKPTHRNDSSKPLHFLSTELLIVIKHFHSSRQQVGNYKYCPLPAFEGSSRSDLTWARCCCCFVGF